ncbi:leucine-rich repeat-containing protein 74A-like [Dreissena polymorpha]|uniref:EF-hand domain-containing protein n=1 Tax=Dreissena polymorpha TaxID=45954 RepID=A0A9D4QSG3_DREPO|nr:leucine-rich repeat-containing protein 74A-like [Dreissena polymorpha]XP_052276576.1 leucine-rich repeat-containing protein 74A-like [Dreissena polymorpha]XP_052276577.1 leucine-rich repeat-containing protein 74A-like [Dreissena polymorpha]XP_052276578.1 leucine-rich repeat-containing protein 74A-like [Dreissena polymorpha]KAH3841936.1 hypothetical protein DPMN_115423 [Dreissena polymorpha]
MVVVNPKPWSEMSPDDLENDPARDSPDSDLRMRLISGAFTNMENGERDFFAKQSDLHKLDKLQSTPRTRSAVQTQRMTKGGQTILNHTVPFTYKNSAISSSYISPRQHALTASRVKKSAAELVEYMRNHTMPNMKIKHIAHSSATSFDYDESEELPLEMVKSYIKPKRYVVETEEIYTRACSFMHITASQTYVKQVSSTRAVSMANTSLSNVSVKPIAISLVRDHRIHTLDLSGNDLGPLGTMYIAEMLAVNDTICELNLTSTNPGRDGLEALATRIYFNNTLNVLRLESNALDHTEMTVVVDLIKNAPNLQELYLGHNNLGYEGGKLLATELERNTTLRVLDLQWNHFRRESAMHVCSAIKSNNGLRKLNLSWNGLGKEGCIALAKSLPSNKSLKSLDLTNNRIDVVALPFLLHGLVRNTGLESLHLAKNPMTTEGVKAVVRAITGAEGVAINYLNVEDIPVDKAFTELADKLRDKKFVEIEHGAEMYSAIELRVREHDPHDLNRFDPVMVIIEYMRIDNLRLVDLFQFFDTGGRGLISRENLRDGVATLGLPLTEHHLDLIMEGIDRKRDGYIDLEEFMVAQRDMSKTIIQRTTRAKRKGKEDLGLKELRQILKELVEKRSKKNKEKASIRVKSAALARANSAASNKSMGRGRKRVRTKRASLTVTKPSYSTVTSK